jgi:hypothetical protein
MTGEPILSETPAAGVPEEDDHDEDEYELDEDDEDCGPVEKPQAAVPEEPVPHLLQAAPSQNV